MGILNSLWGYSLKFEYKALENVRINIKFEYLLSLGSLNTFYNLCANIFIELCFMVTELFFLFSGMRFSSKKIVLMTDFSGEFSDDQASKIIAGLTNSGIELSVMLVIIQSNLFIYSSFITTCLDT